MDDKAQLEEQHKKCHAYIYQSAWLNLKSNCIWLAMVYVEIVTQWCWSWTAWYILISWSWTGLRSFQPKKIEKYSKKNHKIPLHLSSLRSWKRTALALSWPQTNKHGRSQLFWDYVGIEKGGQITISLSRAAKTTWFVSLHMCYINLFRWGWFD